MRSAPPRIAPAPQATTTAAPDRPPEAIIPFLDALAEILVKRALKDPLLRRLSSPLDVGPTAN